MIKEKILYQFKAFLPSLVVTLYWCWQLFRFLVGENRVPESLNKIFFLSCTEAICALIVVNLLLKVSFDERISTYFSSDVYLGLFKKGLRWGLLSFVLINFIFSPAGQILPQIFHLSDIKVIQNADTSFFFKSRLSIFYWFFISIIGGGLAEETIRYFSIHFFERQFGKNGFILSVLISSVFFGLGHLYQGMPWAIAHFFSGLLWSYLYFRERSLIVNIVTHGFFDLMGSSIACFLYFS